MPHQYFRRYTFCNGGHPQVHQCILRMCLPHRIHGCKALTPYACCCIAEETARKCILCHQLGQFLAPHMIVSSLSFSQFSIPYISDKGELCTLILSEKSRKA